MASFLDIAPLSETVTIRGLDFEVTGLELKHLALAIHRFPELRGLLPAAGGAAAPARPDADAIIGLGSEVCAALIAYAAGKEGEEAAIAKLVVGELFSLVDPILRLSFPEGLTPFVNRLAGLIGGEAGGRIAATLGKAPASSS
jgi:hypothetical protein